MEKWQGGASTTVRQGLQPHPSSTMVLCLKGVHLIKLAYRARRAVCAAPATGSCLGAGGDDTPGCG